MSFEDRTLACKDCSQDFTFTSKEQEFYAEKGFTNDPVRCKPCRDARKASMNRNRGGGGRGGPPRGRGGGGGFGGGRGGGGRGPRELFDVTCAECGVDTQVPFKPSGDKPVLCRDCFRK